MHCCVVSVLGVVNEVKIRKLLKGISMKDDVEQLVETVVLGLQEKKGTDIVILDMRQLDHSITDFFVICQGESNTQVAAIAEAVEEMVWSKRDEKPVHVEGKQIAQWVLIDFVDVVVHVFQKSTRSFYCLEELWADARRTDVENFF